MLKPLTWIRTFIVIITLAYLAACGRGFKTLDPQTIKALEDTNVPKPVDGSKGPAQPVEVGGSRSTLTATAEQWTQAIPNKYDDVGDFFRVKEVPGLGQDKILDTVKMDANGESKTLKLVRGRLRLSNISHYFNSPTNELEVKGDVVFNDGKPMGFVLIGIAGSEEISLHVKDSTSPLKNIFTASAVCSTGANDEIKRESADFCRRLTLDFYYRSKDTFYTDQLISKDILFDEIKQKENQTKFIPDPIFKDIPDEELSDYEKDQKAGIVENADQDDDDELPYYYSQPNIDNLAKLYPDVSRDIEAQKEAFFKTKKKIRAVPELTGEEKLPEKDIDLKVQPKPDVPPVKKPEETKPQPEKPAEKPPVATPVGSRPATPPTPPVTTPPVATPGKTDPAKPTTPPVTTPSATKPPVATPQKPPVTTPATPTPVTPTPQKPPVTTPVATPAKPPKTEPPKTEPPKTQTPPPVKKPPVTQNPTVVPAAPGSRPIDQAIGKAMGDGARLFKASSLLEAAQKLGDSAGFEILWPTKKRHYGTYDMVDLVVNLGAWLKDNLPSIPLSIGDTAALNGGGIGSHGSHRTGMDIDLAYLTSNRKLVMNRLDVPNKGGYTHSEFLAADQWKLMKMAHEISPIEVIYVNRNIKNEMCKQALKAGDLKSNTDTSSPAAAILTKMIVERGRDGRDDTNHGTHWHVRLDCTTLKSLRLQGKCIPHPQRYVGTECKNVKL